MAGDLEVKDQAARIGAALGLITKAASDLGVALAKVSAELAALVALLADVPTEPDAPTLTADVGDAYAVVTWTGQAKRWRISRDGTDSQGAGPWSTDTNEKALRFGNLRPGASYVITLTPLDPVGDPVSITIKMKGTVTPPTGDTVAQRLGWGDLSKVIWRDEFDYTGDPDPKRWMPCGQKGVGWDGHAKNGRRMPECTTVRDGMLVMEGRSNGHTGWLRGLNYAKHGRVEFRSRSRNTGGSGATYHPLGLWWPTDPENWPEEGELDCLEYTDPDAKSASAWLHYPHPEFRPNGERMPIQQEGPFSTPCDMTQWNTFNFEWNSTGVRGWINGKKWYDVRDGGGPNGRRNIQDMPKGMWTFQLDNFSKNGPWRPAVFEIDYVRFYPV